MIITLHVHRNAGDLTTDMRASRIVAAITAALRMLPYRISIVIEGEKCA